MTARDTLLLLGGLLVAGVLSVLLLSSALVAPRPEDGRPRVVVARSPIPSARPVSLVERQLPPGFQFLRPVVRVEREVSNVAREAAGFLLLLILTAGTLVLARDQVVRTHAASAGGWSAQARVLGIGVGVVLAVASVAALGGIFVLGSLAGRPPPLFLFGIQLGFMVTAVIVLLILLAGLVGFSAATWRLGTLVLRAPPWRSLGELVPGAVAALLGTALVLLATQLPLIGPIIGAGALAYSLGAFVLGRLAPAAG